MTSISLWSLIINSDRINKLIDPTGQIATIFIKRSEQGKNSSTEMGGGQNV